jgi:hypothetical protein
MPSSSWHSGGMSETDDGDPHERASLARIKAALEERDKAMDEIRQRSAEVEGRFWRRVTSEIATGQISQADAGRELGVTRETLRQRTRHYIPEAPARPTRRFPIYFAIGMRLPGERRWRAVEEPCDSHPTLILSFGGDLPDGRSPYDGHDIEYAYREIDAYPAGLTDVLVPTFPAQLNSRPLFMSNAVADELFGPPHVNSRERLAWEARTAKLEK